MVAAQVVPTGVEFCVFLSPHIFVCDKCAGCVFSMPAQCDAVHLVCMIF